MTFPLIIENGSRFADRDATLAWLQSEVPSLKSQLAASGAILFRGFPVGSAEDFDAFSAVFGYGDFTYQESLSNAVRINFTPRVFTANEAPPEVEIFLHHEMAQTPVSPDKLFFCCLKSAEQGGATPLCRSDLLYAALQEQHPDLARDFASLGLKYTTLMPFADDANSGQGRSWQSTLSVTSVGAAEAKLAELGYTWAWQPDQALLATTPVLPAVRQLPDGSESFYNQVIAAWLGWKRVGNGKGAALTFGDGRPIPETGFSVISELAKAFTFDLDWQDGDVALVDNHRVMHGRRPYKGNRKRQVLVSLAQER